MHHSKAEILRGLDPTNPATIQALIDFHRGTFGGWKMSTQPVETPPVDPAAPREEDPPGDPADKPLGPNGEKALQSERDARKAIENEFAQFKTGLAAALGLKDKDAKSGSEDIVASLQQQMADLQHNNLVLSLANENEITDKDDLNLLRGFKGDEDAIRKLASRLKPTKQAEPETNGKRRVPAPDPSQGRGDNKPLSGREVGLAEARKRFPQQVK